MAENHTVWRSLGRGKVLPSEVLNTLIELDNRRGLLGLWSLEAELSQHLPRLRPRAQALAKTWLEAISLYRDTYYPENAVSKIFTRIVKPHVKVEALPKAG